MAEEDHAYLAWVRAQPCAARALGPCWGGIEAHHDRDMTGLALRSHDHRAIPLCRRHHQHVDQAARGIFSGKTRDERRDFFEAALFDTRERWERWRAITWF